MIDAPGTVDGFSGYAHALVRRLWGDGVVDAHTPPLGGIVWRASAQYRRFLNEKIKTERNLASDASYYEWLMPRFEEAAAKGEPTVYEPARRTSATKRPENP